jgi:hypothetical protein
MQTVDIAFCRHLLGQGLADLKKFAPHIRPMKDGWVWSAGRDHWEFHGPGEYYWHGRAGNAYEARYKGWMAWLKAQGHDL